MMQYAQCDTHYLPYLADRLRWELLNPPAATPSKHCSDAAPNGSIRANGHHEARDESEGEELPVEASEADGVDGGDGLTACFLCWGKRRGSETAGKDQRAGNGVDDSVVSMVVESESQSQRQQQRGRGQDCDDGENSGGSSSEGGSRMEAATRASALYKEAVQRSNALSLQLYEKDNSLAEMTAQHLFRQFLGDGRALQPGRSQTKRPFQGHAEHRGEDRDRGSIQEDAGRCGTCGCGSLVGAVRAALLAVVTWRDAVAREEDESVRFVMADAAVVAVAVCAPTTSEDLIACVQHITPGLCLPEKHAGDALQQPKLEL